MFAIYVGWRLRSYTTNNGALPDKQVFLFFVQQASPDTRVGIFYASLAYFILFP